MSRPLLLSGPALARFAARVLDELIQLAILYPIVTFAGNSAFSVAMFFAVPLVYHMWAHASRQQATPGEHIMKLYVVNRHGTRLTMRQSLERSLAYMMPWLPAFTSAPAEVISTLIFFLVFAWFAPILLTRNATGVHDMLCGTRVVAGRVAS